MDHQRDFDAAFFVQWRLEFDLNNNDIFDFEYLPEEGDKIEFFFEELDTDGFETAFVFVNGNFKTEEMGEEYINGLSLAHGSVRYVI